MALFQSIVYKFELQIQNTEYRYKLVLTKGSRHKYLGIFTNCWAWGMTPLPPPAPLAITCNFLVAPPSLSKPRWYNLLCKNYSELVHVWKITLQECIRGQLLSSQCTDIIEAKNRVKISESIFTCFFPHFPINSRKRYQSCAIFSARLTHQFLWELDEANVE